MMQGGLATSPELSGFEYELTYQNNDNASILRVTSRSEAQLFFPITRGDGKFVGALSEVTVGREHIEVALVLDISSSMGRQNKIVELRGAATNFIQTLMGNEDIQGRVSISIVPFGGSVKLPSELDFMLNTPPTDQHWIDGEWNGCVSVRPDDYDTGFTPQLRLNYMPDFTAYDSSRNNWCPRGADNEMIGLTNHVNTLTNKIAGLALSDGTAMDIGVAWGLATLDTRWRGQIHDVSSGSPRNFNARTKKIMIVMTDGGITGQRYPDNNLLLTGSPPFETLASVPSHEILTEDVANTGYENICDETKSKGVEIFTIGFELNTPAKLNRLQYCGTSQAHNYEADLGQLTTVFDNIATSVTGLRLSQ